MVGDLPHDLTQEQLICSHISSSGCCQEMDKLHILRKSTDLKENRLIQCEEIKINQLPVVFEIF